MIRLSWQCRKWKLRRCCCEISTITVFRKMISTSFQFMQLIFFNVFSAHAHPEAETIEKVSAAAQAKAAIHNLSSFQPAAPHLICTTSLCANSFVHVQLTFHIPVRCLTIPACVKPKHVQHIDTRSRNISSSRWALRKRHCCKRRKTTISSARLQRRKFAISRTS